jgi:hypothetical protein
MLNLLDKHIIQEPSIHFRHIYSGEIYLDIWDQLEQGLWRYIIPENYEYNVKQGMLNRTSWRPELKDILPIYPGMKWCDQQKQRVDPYFVPIEQESCLKDFLIAAESFFEPYLEKKIGVQLSGGLDSSIIIGLLKYFGIPFSLVGMFSTSYAFRTERHIQQILAECGNTSILINYEDHLPFSELQLVPKFQYPDNLCLNFSADNAMALECENLGIDVLFTGNGGDNVFAEKVPAIPDQCTWRPQVFIDSWLNDIVYAPRSVQLKPFYADKQIMNTIFNLRKGQQEDNLKVWARQFFKDFLPDELVNYTYCADFWGLYIDGLHGSISKVRDLCNSAYELTENSYFSNKSVSELLNQDLLNANKSMYQEIESRLSLAVWLNALIK